MYPVSTQSKPLVTTTLKSKTNLLTVKDSWLPWKRVNHKNSGNAKSLAKTIYVWWCVVREKFWRSYVKSICAQQQFSSEIQLYATPPLS